MIRTNSLLGIYQKAAIDTIATIRRGLWGVLPLVAFVFFLITIFPIIVGTLGLVGSLIGSLLLYAILSVYYAVLGELTRSKQIHFQDLVSSFPFQTLYLLLGTGFILWILNFVLGSFRGEMAWVRSGISLLMFLLINPLPESVYLQNSEGIEAIQDSLSFTTRFWIEWFLPIAVFFGIFFFFLSPELLSDHESLLLFLSSSDPLIPFVLPLQLPFTLLEFIPVILAVHFYMVFRANLFSALWYRR